MGMPPNYQRWGKQINRHPNQSRALESLIWDTWPIVQHQDVELIVNTAFQVCDKLLIGLPLRSPGIANNPANSSDLQTAKPNFFTVQKMKISPHSRGRPFRFPKGIVIAGNAGHPLKLATKCLPDRSHISRSTTFVERRHRV